MRKYEKKKSKGMFSAVVALLLLAGCSCLEKQEMAAGQAKEKESSIEVIDFNEYNTVSEQEAEEQEPTTQETETVQEDAVKIQPPEGFELKFETEEWGLSFGEPGTQSVGNHTYHYPDMSAILDQESFKKELDDMGYTFKPLSDLTLH